jgi:hypothetical protein
MREPLGPASSRLEHPHAVPLHEGAQQVDAVGDGELGSQLSASFGSWCELVSSAGCGTAAPAAECPAAPQTPGASCRATAVRELGTGGDRVRFVHRGQQPVDRRDALFVGERGEVACGEHADVLAESSCRLGLLDRAG